MDTMVCDRGLTIADVQTAEHVHLHAVGAVGATAREVPPDLARRLGWNPSLTVDPAARRRLA